MFLFGLKNKKQITIIIFLILCNIFAPFEYLKSEENFKDDIRDNKFEKILKSDELVKIGLDNIDQKNYKNAIIFFNKASKIDPTNSDAHFYKAFVKNIIGDFEGAIEDYSKAIILIKLGNHFLMGLTKTKINDFKGSIFDFSQLLKLNPNYNQGFYLRGISKQKTGDFKGSIIDFSKYLNLNGDDSNILFLKRIFKIFSERFYWLY